ncbi:MAG: chloride channel protein [Bacteroidales bacterium]
MIKISRFIEIRDIKDYLVSIIAGVIVGIFCLFFRWIINLVSSFRIGFLTNEWPIYYRIPIYMVLVYIILLLISKMIQRLPEIAGNGAEQTKGLLNGRISRKHNIRKLMQKFVGSVGSLGCGMGLGHEGPSIQFGGYLGVFTSRLFHVTPGREENILSAGASAGVAAALNATLAGPVYIIESLQKLNNYRMAICVLLAGLTGGLLAAIFMPQNPYSAIPLIKPNLPDDQLLLVFIGMGFYMALIGIAFTLSVKYIRLHFYSTPRSSSIRLLVLVCWMGLLAIYYPNMLGSGQPFMIEEAIAGKTEFMYVAMVAFLSFIFTAYSQGTTFPGGAFLPLLTLGGLCGRLYALMMIQLGYCEVESLPYFMFLGMSSCFIVVIRTPLTGFLLVSEMTGRFDILLPSMAVGTVAYFLVSIVRIESLPGDLYGMLIKNLPKTAAGRLFFYTEVMPGSYLEGKTLNTVDLPDGCQVEEVLRKDHPVALNDKIILEQGDQVKYAVLPDEAEKVYQALIALSSDLR